MLETGLSGSELRCRQTSAASTGYQRRQTHEAQSPRRLSILLYILSGSGGGTKGARELWEKNLIPITKLTTLAMRPLNSISNTADSPINMPPMVEATGVKGVMTAMAPCYGDRQTPSNVRLQLNLEHTAASVTPKMGL